MWNESSFAIPIAVCTLATCPLSEAQVSYIPSLAGNALFLAIFGLLFLFHFFLGIRYRTWGVLVGTLGCSALEVIGYAGRLLLRNNPFSFGAFDMEFICLTIAPAFLTASIYLCLARIIIVYGQQYSRLKPRTYSILFVGCDFLSLVLQAVGGAFAATAHTDIKQGDLGVNIMIAGLAFQIFSLIVFMGLWMDFTLRVRRARSADARAEGEEALELADVRGSFKFKAFKAGLWTASICIFLRSIYRLVELHAGFGSAVANNEPAFMVLEGPLIIIAVGVMTAFHPGPAFKGKWAVAAWSFRNKGAKTDLDERKDMTQTDSA